MGRNRFMDPRQMIGPSSRIQHILRISIFPFLTGIDSWGGKRLTHILEKSETPLKPLQPFPGMPARIKQPCPSEAVENGERIRVDDQWASRKPSNGFPVRGSLLTWSRLKGSGGGLKCPTASDHKTFAKYISDSLKSLQAKADDRARTEKQPVEVMTYYVAVFREPHGSADFHYTQLILPAYRLECQPFHFHAVAWCDKPTTVYGSLQAELKAKHLAVDVRVPIEDTDRSLLDMMEYLMVPHSKKFLVELEPFFSEGFPGFTSVLEKRRKKYQQLQNKHATNEQMLGLVLNAPQVRDAKRFRDFIDAAHIQRYSTKGVEEEVFS